MVGFFVSRGLRAWDVKKGGSSHSTTVYFDRHQLHKLNDVFLYFSDSYSHTVYHSTRSSQLNIIFVENLFSRTMVIIVIDR